PRMHCNGSYPCAVIERSFNHNDKIGLVCFYQSELAGQYRSHHRCGYVMVRHSAPPPFPMNAITEPRTTTLTVNEIYYSIQGESTWAGLPCVFVRLTF